MADADDLVELVSVPVEFQAEAIAASLRERGVPARAIGGALAGFRAEAPALVRVVVLRRDLPAARAALERARAESVDIDWEDVDVGEPEDPGVAAGAGPDARGLAHGDAVRADRRRRFALVALAMAVLVAAVAVRVPVMALMGVLLAASLVVAWALVGLIRGPVVRTDPFDRRHW